MPPKTVPPALLPVKRIPSSNAPIVKHPPPSPRK
jgi:hypothetical protein